MIEQAPKYEVLSTEEMFKVFNRMEERRTTLKTDEKSKKEFAETETAAIYWLMQKETEMMAQRPELKKLGVNRRELLPFKHGFYAALELMHRWGKI
jgi:hypothetical protein